MKIQFCLAAIIFIYGIYQPQPGFAQAFPGAARTEINLNGTWEFDQTLNAFPPSSFTRTIPVPGLLHLAVPVIEDYAKFFKRPQKVDAKETHSVYDIDYVPKYSWYRKKISISDSLRNREAVITLKKSMFVTTVFVNGMEAGSSMACFTPVEFPVTRFLIPGKENEILVRLGDRTWLPSEAAGGTDKEKEKYLPGIWDDVILSFTGKVRIDRMLILPSVSEKKITARFRLRNFVPAQLGYGDPMTDTCSLSIVLREMKSGKLIIGGSANVVTKRDNITEISMDIPLEDPHTWSPDDPFLYIADAWLDFGGSVSDRTSKRFGMRDFGINGKYFYLNGEKTILRGTNITLHRFFEDPDCSNLAWDRQWVTRFLGEIPKSLNWNAMRVCVGLVPDFWYDIADEYGLMFQNEWMYWQNHGWDEEIRKEYTDWVWSDGCHPSIVIWDAINENTDDYIGNILVPELKQLDNTRVWDNGYMVTGNMRVKDDLDEPHLYTCTSYSDSNYIEHFELGNLDKWPDAFKSVLESDVPQLVNEYSWIWLWRNGIPSKLTVGNYDFFCGKNATPEQRFELQAYWVQLETEWIRCQRSIAGVLAFTYLTNNYGYTGDWFTGNIKDLEPSPSLRWLKNAFAPAAVFIDLTDQRYMKNQVPYRPASELSFNFRGVNDLPVVSEGKLNIRLLDSKGKQVFSDQMLVSLEPDGLTKIPYNFILPAISEGYLLLAEYTPEGSTNKQISRRYIKVGKTTESDFRFCESDPGSFIP
jgi:beta-galactosidase